MHCLQRLPWKGAVLTCNLPPSLVPCWLVQVSAPYLPQEGLGPSEAPQNSSAAFMGSLLKEVCAPSPTHAAKGRLEAAFFGRGKGRHDGSKLSMSWQRSAPVCLLDCSSPDPPSVEIFPFPVIPVCGKKASLAPWEGLCPHSVLRQCIVKKGEVPPLLLAPESAPGGGWQSLSL